MAEESTIRSCAPAQALTPELRRYVEISFHEALKPIALLVDHEYPGLNSAFFGMIRSFEVELEAITGDEADGQEETHGQEETQGLPRELIRSISKAVEQAFFPVLCLTALLQDSGGGTRDAAGDILLVLYNNALYERLPLELRQVREVRA